VYDTSHQNILLTIATQAAAAIQNARLYSRTDESLNRRVQELDSILRTSRDGILLLDLHWRILLINPTLADWINVAQAGLIGRPLEAFLEGREPLTRLIGYTPKGLRDDCDALAHGKWEQREALVLLGPSVRHVQRTLIPVRDPYGVIAGWMLAFRDMTEEIELARLRDDMTEMLVHDLRSPLTAVVGSIALMQRTFEKRDMEGFERFRSMAQRNSDRILHTVNQLLDISRLESGQLPIECEELDVLTLLREAEARFASLVVDAQVTFTLEAAADLPAITVDPRLISRVLDNLLDNAVKYTPDGGHVRLWARGETDQAPQTMLLGVTDTGPGIPLEAQARLFAKFEQVADVEGRRGGTGLGLAFCKLAVEAHGGRMSVQSVVGKGSTFIVTLPLACGASRKLA
jgi:signal transduction histidine kinase